MSVLVLVYLKEKLIKPFLILWDMPYELSKGRLEDGMSFHFFLGAYCLTNRTIIHTIKIILF